MADEDRSEVDPKSIRIMERLPSRGVRIIGPIDVRCQRDDVRSYARLRAMAEHALRIRAAKMGANVIAADFRYTVGEGRDAFVVAKGIAARMETRVRRCTRCRKPITESTRMCTCGRRNRPMTMTDAAAADRRAILVATGAMAGLIVALAWPLLDHD